MPAQNESCRFFWTGMGQSIWKRNYLCRPEELVVFPGTGAALRRLQEPVSAHHFVTNQSASAAVITLMRTWKP